VSRVLKSFLRIVVVSAVLFGVVMAGAWVWKSYLNPAASDDYVLPSVSASMPSVSVQDVPVKRVGDLPGAVAQGTLRGRTVHDLFVHNGGLYAGYGDYDTNTGPIDVSVLNLSDYSWGSFLSVPTEEVNVFREINGNLFVPYIDPRMDWSKNVGFASDKNGVWENFNVTPFIHVYDVASSDGQDLWLSGSMKNPNGDGGVAVIKRSVDGGLTWTVERVASADPAPEFDRFYWLASVGGKMYAQPNLVGSVSNMVVWDSVSGWVDSGVQVPSIQDSKNVVVFQGKIYFNNLSNVSVFDPATGVLDVLSVDSVVDFYVTSDALYVLNMAGIVQKSVDGVNWVGYNPVLDLADSGVSFSSVAVDGNKVFLGQDSGAGIFEGVLP
jgi:hypothetical protein